MSSSQRQAWRRKTAHQRVGSWLSSITDSAAEPTRESGKVDASTTSTEISDTLSGIDAAQEVRRISRRSILGSLRKTRAAALTCEVSAEISDTVGGLDAALIASRTGVQGIREHLIAAREFSGFVSHDAVIRLKAARARREILNTLPLHWQSPHFAFHALTVPLEAFRSESRDDQSEVQEKELQQFKAFCWSLLWLRDVEEYFYQLTIEKDEQCMRRALVEQEGILEQTDRAFIRMWRTKFFYTQHAFSDMLARLQTIVAACENANIDVSFGQADISTIRTSFEACKTATIKVSEWQHHSWLGNRERQQRWLMSPTRPEDPSSDRGVPRVPEDKTSAQQSNVIALDGANLPHYEVGLVRGRGRSPDSMCAQSDNPDTETDDSSHSDMNDSTDFDTDGNIDSDKDNTLSTGTQTRVPPQAFPTLTTPPIERKTRPPRIVRDLRLPVELDGREISAFPDIGAAANFIALEYVCSHGLTVNSTARRFVRTAVGSVVDILGIVTLTISFKDEKEVHHLEFNVLRNAIHDVIIGSPFLKLTKTFTQYKHRLQQTIRSVHEIRLPRLRFLESHQYVRGWVNGFYVDAVPDTGADVSVMSMAFAKGQGFDVNTNSRHRILLEFADGSTATSIGMVRDMDWSFRGSDVQHRIDVYVLEELKTHLILDNTFLYDTDAFVAHEREFWEDDSDNLQEDAMLSIIKLVHQALTRTRLKDPSKYSGSVCR